MKCLKCGKRFDPAEESYGVIVDGTKYVCSDCLNNHYAALSSGYTSPETNCFADATYGNNSISTWGHASEKIALRCVSVMAKRLWGVESFEEILH
jgi:hypothetical protein